jgi:hypothetical protein
MIWKKYGDHEEYYSLNSSDSSSFKYYISFDGGMYVSYYNDTLIKELKTLSEAKIICETHFKKHIQELIKQYKSGTKVCNTCFIDKNVNQYSKAKSNFDNLKTKCKQCCIDVESQRNKTIDGVVRSLYNGQLCSAKKKKYKMPNYNLVEFRVWLANQPTFYKLYTYWVESNYDTYLKPSIDRINTSIGYRFDNIQIITWRENMDNNYKERTKN